MQPNPHKIDIHTHILPPAIPRFKDLFGYGGFITLEHQGACGARMVRDDGHFFRHVHANCWDPDVRLKECDEQGVNVQVLSTVPVMFSYWAKPEDTLYVAQHLNDHIAGVVAKHPRRYVGLATVPLQDTELAIRELTRAVCELGMAGVQIGTNVNGKNLDDPSLYPFFQAAERLSAAVFVHPWDMLGQERMQRYWLPWLVGMPLELALAISSLVFAGIFSKLPKLRLAFAHGGGAYPGLLGRIEHGYHARPDLCATDNPLSPKAHLGRFWVDSLVHDAAFLEYLIKLFGPERVLLGSDYPFPLGEDQPGALVASLPGLDPAAMGAIFAGNALAWLGRQAHEFW